ncbi:MAG: PAS domain-containing protein [Bacteroidetes bacterium]|nr:PAS domain-containing protein [Bacteroidota bacterium]
MKKVIFLVVLNIHFITLQTNYVLAQPKDIRFKHLTVNDGLSYGGVITITQDKYGFIWIGTDDGLNRYDGNSFQIYKNDRRNINSIRSGTVSKIYEDSRGVFWIGTANGVDIYDRQNDRFIRDPRFSNQKIASIVEDVDGSLWIVSTFNIYHLDVKNDSVEIYSQNDITGGRTRTEETNREMIISRRGEVWIGSSSGIHIYDKKRKLFIQVLHDNNKPNSLLSNNVRSLLEDNAGRIWIGTDAGLDVIDNFDKNPVDYTFYHFKNSNDPRSITGGTVRTLLEDDKQNLWIGTTNSLDLLDLKTFKKGINSFIHYKNDPGKRTSLNNNSIYSLFQDNQKNIWIGTYSNGINIISSIPEKFDLFMSEPGFKNTLSNNQVNCFFEDGDILWIGTEGGLNRYNKKDDTFKHYIHDPLNRKALSSNNILSICKDRYGSLWIGTWGGGLNRFDYGTETFEYYYNDPNDTNSISSNDIFSVIEDKDGNLWIGTLGGGLNMFDRTKKRFVRLNTQNSGIYSNFVLEIKESKNGDLWLTNYTAAVRFDKKKGSYECFVHSDSDSGSISSNRIVCIFEDSNGNIWIGTNAGLNLWNKTTGKFTCYQKADGLSDNYINSILEDNDGNLWMGTNNGLSKFLNAVNLPEKPKFKNYTYEDGLQGVVFAKRSYLKGKNGIMYFGGTNGFNAFDPGKIMENTYIPPIVITGFEVFNKPVSIGERGLGKNWFADEPLVLSYKQSMFSISFAALNYISSKRNQYAYKLEGFDQDWNYVGTRNTATYTNLDPGKYFFRVKGSNNDGVWNEIGVSLPIVIKPPFWETLWFRLILLAVLTVVVYWIYKWRMQTREFAEQKRMDAVLTKEHNLLRTLIDLIPDYIYLKDTESRFILANKALLQSFGKENMDEIYGKTDFDFHPLENARVYFADEQEIIRSGQMLLSKEEPVVEATGQRKWNISTKIPFKDLQGRIVGLVGIGRDITERKLTEEALRKSKAQLNNALKIANLGYWEFDNATRLFIFNDQFYNLFHTTAEKEGGYSMSPAQYIRRFVNSDDVHIVDDIIQRGVESTDLIKTEAQLEHRIIYADGGTGYFSVRISIVRDENSRTIKVYGVNQDITERKLAEEALSQKTALLEAQLNSSIDGVLVVDKQGKKILQNQRTVELWKIPQEIADNPDDQMQVAHVMHATKDPDQFVSKVKYLYSHPDETSRDEIELNDGTVLDRYSAPVIGSDGRYHGRIWSFRDITEGKRAEKEREKLIGELQDALADVKLLSGLVPICANCKKIRDDQGYWTQIESYIQDRSNAKFSHSICPECAKKLYPNYNTDKMVKKNNDPGEENK